MKFSTPLKSILPAAILGFVALGLTPTSAVAQANPATTTFNVTATVLKDCIVSATALPFGNYTGANWGNTSGSWVSGTGSGAAQPLAVYGVLPAGQYVPPGSYTDTIAVTVTY